LRKCEKMTETALTIVNEYLWAAKLGRKKKEATRTWSRGPDTSLAIKREEKNLKGHKRKGTGWKFKRQRSSRKYGRNEKKEGR